MYQPYKLQIDDLTVDTFEPVEPINFVQNTGRAETGCLSDCASGCAGQICGELVY